MASGDAEAEKASSPEGPPPNENAADGGRAASPSEALLLEEVQMTAKGEDSEKALRSNSGKDAPRRSSRTWLMALPIFLATLGASALLRPKAPAKPPAVLNRFDELLKRADASPELSAKLEEQCAAAWRLWGEIPESGRTLFLDEHQLKASDVVSLVDGSKAVVEEQRGLREEADKLQASAAEGEEAADESLQRRVDFWVLRVRLLTNALSALIRRLEAVRENDDCVYQEQARTMINVATQQFTESGTAEQRLLDDTSKALKKGVALDEACDGLISAVATPFPDDTASSRSDRDVDRCLSEACKELREAASPLEDPEGQALVALDAGCVGHALYYALCAVRNARSKTTAALARLDDPSLSQHGVILSLDNALTRSREARLVAQNLVKNFFQPEEESEEGTRSVLELLRVSLLLL